jgi:hypothetical protein
MLRVCLTLALCALVSCTGFVLVSHLKVSRDNQKFTDLLLGKPSPRVVRLEFIGQQRHLVVTNAQHINDINAVISKQGHPGFPREAGIAYGMVFTFEDGRKVTTEGSVDDRHWVAYRPGTLYQEYVLDPWPELRLWTFEMTNSIRPTWDYILNSLHYREDISEWQTNNSATAVSQPSESP